VAAVLAATGVARAATVTRVSCPQKNVTVLFWPHGHQEIPSVGFPQFLMPHLEVYKSAGSYPDANELAVVQADGGTGVSKSCTPAGKRKARKFENGSRKTTKAAAVRCKSKKAAKLELVADPGKSATLRLYYGTVLGIVASFDKGYCSPYLLPR
jgi:hypothetical protein